MFFIAGAEINELYAARVILINQNNEILLQYAQVPGMSRVDGTPHESFWITPGGKIDQGESLQEAAIRELREETGYIITDILPLNLVDRFILKTPKGTLTYYRNTYFVARIDESTPKESAHLSESEKAYVKQWHWFSLAELQARVLEIHPINSYLAHYVFPKVIQGTWTPES